MMVKYTLLLLLLERINNNKFKYFNACARKLNLIFSLNKVALIRGGDECCFANIYYKKTII